MKATIRSLVVLAAIGSYACAVARADNWVIRQFASGWCYIQGSYDPLTEPQHYTFNTDTGELTLKVDGDWTVIYRSEQYGGDPVDIPFIQGSVTTNQPFTLNLTGKDLTKWLYLDTVSGSGTRVLEVQLDDGGAMLPASDIYADEFVLQNSTIPGSIQSGAVLRVKSVVDDTGSGLSIGGALAGTVHVFDDLSGTIAVGQDLSGLLEIDGDAASGSAINVTGALSGDLSIGGDLAGTLSAGSWLATNPLSNDIFIDGDIATGAVLSIPGDFGHWLKADDVNIDIDVPGNFVAGCMHFTGSVNGEIRIKGHLANQALQSYEISAAALDPDDGAITIDWDGYHSGDDWASGAQVLVGAQIYQSDNWWSVGSDAVYRATCLKGDVNNDNAVNNFDISPFVTIISDGYALV
jgi:hypothetical protein